MFLSAAGPANSIKAVRAALYQPKSAFRLTFLDDDQPADGEVVRDSYNTRIGRGVGIHRGMVDSYECRTAALGTNTWHLIAVSRRVGFMPVADAEAVYQQLCEVRFTAPVLRTWADYLVKRLRGYNAIDDCQCWGCHAAVLRAGDETVEKIVQEGLKSGDIRIA